VERTVAKEFPRFTVIFVRACFGDDVDYTAQNAAKLRLIVVRIHFEFLDVVDDRRNRVRTAEAFLIVQSVQQKKIAPVRLAVNGGERKRPNGVASELLVAAVLRRIYSADARGQVQQLRDRKSTRLNSSHVSIS